MPLGELSPRLSNALVSSLPDTRAEKSTGCQRRGKIASDHAEMDKDEEIKILANSFHILLKRKKIKTADAFLLEMDY